MTRAYVQLAARLRGEGLMDHRPGRFTLRCVLTLAAFAATWSALVVVGDRWAVLAVAAVLGLVTTQIVFFGHEAGHHQLPDARSNRVVGLVAGNALTGLSFGWWEPKHGAHHAHPNQIGRDPDIGPGAVAFTAEAARRHSRFGRWAARAQAWTFFPLLTLEGLGLHVASVQSLWRRRDRAALNEAILLTVHLGLYLTVIFSVLSPLRALAFIAVHQAVFGVYLGVSFAPNHKGMPTLAEDERVGFAERQVLTARNVSGGRLTSFALGGLNHQIEHHLFPKMPMANLGRACPHVQQFCRDTGLTYREDSLLASYRAALAHLRRIGGGGVDPSLADGAGPVTATVPVRRTVAPTTA